MKISNRGSSVPLLFKEGLGVVDARNLRILEKKNNLNKLLKHRKDLRNNSTNAEIFLWQYLKESKLEKRKFRRQHSFAYYILDFYCPKEKLGIELDGDSHFSKNGILYDKERDEYLKREGIKILRFTNEEVLNNIEHVLNKIKNTFKK
jgi:very-short-patch-repair endonuclease